MEARVDAILRDISPDKQSIQRRHSVFDYVRSVISKCFYPENEVCVPLVSSFVVKFVLEDHTIILGSPCRWMLTCLAPFP